MEIIILEAMAPLNGEALSISGANATFSGTIYADKLFGQIQASQIVGLPGSQITSGTIGIPSSLTSSGTIGWPGVLMGTLANGWSYIQANKLSLQITNSQVDLGNGNMNVGANDVYVNNLHVGGSLFTGASGISVDFSVQTQYGRAFLRFSRGILYGYYYG